jgi:hypothetical protein
MMIKKLWSLVIYNANKNKALNFALGIDIHHCDVCGYFELMVGSNKRKDRQCRQ